MKILIATTSFPDTQNDDFAGKFVLNEARAYALNGASVRVVTPHQPGALPTEQLHEHLQVFRFRYFLPARLQRLKTPNKPIYGHRSLLSVLQVPLLLAGFVFHLLKYGRWADLIHCQWTITALLALPCKLLFGTKLVMTVRGSDIRLLPRALNRFIHAHVDAVVDCYGDQKSNYDNQRNFPAAYVKLPLIVANPPAASPTMPKDMRAALAHKKHPFVILYVGRFDQVKIDSGLPVLTLIEAADIIRQSHGADFHIIYVGDGHAQIKAKMQNMVSQFGLENWVSFLGAKNNVYDYMQYCDLGVGGIAFNAVSQEFSHLKKSQLLFKGLHNRQTPWEDKVSTLFFEAQHVESLSETIIYAMADRTRLEKIGRQAHALMNRYVQKMQPGGAAYMRAFANIIAQE
jgi:glycosyltransferase involved in cell wall biosynthesis